MFNYCASNEIAADRVMLIDLVGKKGDDFGHIKVEFIREAVRDRVNPDTMVKEFNDGETANGYRRTSFSSKKKTAYMIEDLVIWSQMSADRPDEKPYAVGVQYMNLHTVEKNQAMHMFKTLDKLDKELTKLDHEFGYGTNDLATYITRVASIMGIKKFVTYKKQGARGYYGSRSLDDPSNFNTWNATDIAYVVNEMLNEFHGRDTRAIL